MNLQALAKQHPLQITASVQDDVGVINMSGVIYNWDQEYFKSMLDDFVAQKVKRIKLFINTPGGDVFAANEIVIAIKRTGIPVDGFGGAIVASAGTYIAINLHSFEMPKNGQFMYHKPSATLQGNEDAIASRLKLLQNITQDYREQYATKMNLTTEEIEERWVKADVWLTAQEAFEQGLITKVGEEVDVSENEALFIAALANPKEKKKEENHLPIINSNTKMKNKDAIISKLGLAKDASDEQILEALNKVVEKADKVEKLEANAEKIRKESIEAMLTTAVEGKKITQAQVPHFRALAEKDLESTTALIKEMTPVVKVSAQLDSGSSSDASKADWTMQDYIDKDITALEALMTDDPEKFKELEKAHYAK